MTKSRGINAPRHVWTPIELRLLRELYPDVPCADVAALLDMPMRVVYSKAKKLGVGKSPEFFASDMAARIKPGAQPVNSMATRFKPGRSSWNKGRKGYRAPGSEKGHFPKGKMPHNWVPVGTYRINNPNKYGKKPGIRPYLELKVSDVQGPPHLRWHPVHRLVWEAANGPVPEGFVAFFKPGCHTVKLEEITADKVEVVSRKEHALRVHPRNISPEYAKLVHLKGQISRQVNRINREHEQRSQQHDDK